MVAARERPARYASTVGALLPRTFRSISLLRTLNVLAVGLSLAALSAAVFAFVFGASEAGAMGVIVGAPTLALGTAWAALLRHRATIGQSRVRWGWLASIPLAALNGGLACALLFAGGQTGDTPVERFVFGLFAGVTFGAFVWVPALVATILLFGLPLIWAERLAKKGLAGEERGEVVVGAASAALAALALIAQGRVVTDVPYVSSPAFAAVGPLLVWGMGGLGLATGLAATLLAVARERRRRGFVAAVEAGGVTGYRVDATGEGKVLVRVGLPGTYRQWEPDEELFALDEEGAAKRAVAGEPYLP